MKARLDHISITNFKAFREFSLKLEGRHLLVYGANGAGKSSLYWALYTFLQSAGKKPFGSIGKYFDPANPQHLLNLHEQKTAAPKPGEIALTLRDVRTDNDFIYRISQVSHDTFNQPAILKGDLASDFITYRFFFGFSDFRNSQKLDLWPLFEREILPFCVSTGGLVPYDMWQRIGSRNPNPSQHRGRAGAKAYDRFKQNTMNFAGVIVGVVDAISTEAQNFYDTHFSADDPAKVTLKLGVITPPSATGSNREDFKFTTPVIEFGVLIDGTLVKPQSFLNEAKLTQLALSVRFAAALVNLHESDLKLLVLDDLLVSLDMSNRMKVVDILLSEAFSNYQKIILTHELGFFHEFRRRIGSNHAEWRFVSLQGNAAQSIEARNEKDDLRRAEDYLNGHDIEEAAMFLRKAAEDMAKRYREWAEGKALPPGEFVSLTQNLRTARKKLLEGIPAAVYEKLIRDTSKEHRELLVSADDTDLDGNATLQPADKGIVRSKRKILRSVLKHDGWAKMEAVEAVDRVLEMTERVLNPASHGSVTPLYEEEVRRAHRLIGRLEKVLLEAQK